MSSMIGCYTAGDFIARSAYSSLSHHIIPSLGALGLLCFQRIMPCFWRRERQSAIMAMNSELVGLPLMFDTV